MFEYLMLFKGRYLQNIVLIVITQPSKNCSRLSIIVRNNSEICANKTLGSGRLVTRIVITVNVKPQKRESSDVSPES
jgi:hypothetical protein